MANPILIVTCVNLGITILGVLAYWNRPKPVAAIRCRPYPAVFDAGAITRPDYMDPDPDDGGTGSTLIYGLRSWDMPHVGDYLHWHGGRISKVTYEREHFRNEAYLVSYELVVDGGDPNRPRPTKA